MLVGV